MVVFKNICPDPLCPFSVPKCYYPPSPGRKVWKDALCDPLPRLSHVSRNPTHEPVHRPDLPPVPDSTGDRTDSNCHPSLRVTKYGHCLCRSSSFRPARPAAIEDGRPLRFRVKAFVGMATGATIARPRNRNVRMEPVRRRRQITWEDGRRLRSCE